MPIFTKKKRLQALMGNKEEREYLFESFSDELVSTEKRLSDIEYQIDFFGVTPELRKEKEEIQLMLDWLRNQFDEIRKEAIH